jgi:putative DNA primase/helicase
MTSTDIERIRNALHFITPEDRDTWWKMGMAIKSELDDSGFDLWNDWSKPAESYKQNDARDVWRSIKPIGGVTIGTLFHEAKTCGWRDDSGYQRPSPEALAERQRVSAGLADKDQANILLERQETSVKAETILKEAVPVAADHPYLVRKRIPAVESLYEIDASAAASILGYSPQSSGNLLTGRLLVVPVKQEGKLSTLELIDSDGRKTALRGRGTKTAGYWLTDPMIGGDGKGKTLLIGEGVATVLSARQATGFPAIAALSSSNLSLVAKATRGRFPGAEIMILADLVKVDGKPEPHAIEAAELVGGKLAVPDFGSNREPDQSDFNDMAESIGEEAVKRVIEAAGDSFNLWTDPQPLTASYTPEPYPLDALPSTVRAAVEEVVGFVQAPLPMVSSAALAALSLAIQAQVDVKRAENLHGPTGLFLLTIADSGERKSTCDGIFTQAIRDYEAEQAEAARPVLTQYKADFEAWEAKRAGIKDQIRHLAKNNKSTANMESGLSDLEEVKPVPPRVPRLMYADVTPEALAHGLATKWPSGGVVSAEAGIVFGSHAMGKDSVMRNLATLNQLWDGANLSIDRRTSDSFTVKGARLTMALQVQESTLREFIRKSGALARGSGFLARFMVAWPASTQGYRPFTEAPANWPALTAFNKRLAAILSQPEPIGDDGALSPVMLSLSPDAKRAWVEFHDAIEGQLASGGELHDVRDVASKTADNAVRLAALFQMFEHGTGAVSGDCFESASLITAWHLGEAQRFFSELSLPEELSDAARLDRWLIEYCGRERVKSVNKRYALQHGPIRAIARMDIAINELIQLDRLRLRKVEKRSEIMVNPRLLESNL